MQSIVKSLEIRECVFQLVVTQATAQIKFPCSFFLEWKTSNGKHSVQSNNRIKASQGVIPFNEQLSLSIFMLYNQRLQHYRKKESIVSLNLLSNSRPNDPKLVGRFEIDLATVANKNNLNQMTQYPLKYCSVEGSITLKAYLRQQKITNIDPNDLERSECSQSQIFGPEFGSSKQDIKASISSQNALSIKSKQRFGSKVDQQNMLNALNESKGAQNLDRTKSPEPVRLTQQKKQVRIQISSKSNNNCKSQSNGLEVEEGLEKRLKNDFSIPRLVKNSSQFDSSKMNSQKTLKNQISQKSLSKFTQSPKAQQQPYNQFSKKNIQENIIHELSAATIKVSQASLDKIQTREIERKEIQKYVQNEIHNLKKDKEVLQRKLQQLQVQHKSKQTKIDQILLDLSEKIKLIEEKDNKLKQYSLLQEQAQLSKLQKEGKITQLQKVIEDQKINIITLTANLRQIQSKFNSQEQKNTQANVNNESQPQSAQPLQDFNHRYQTELKNHQNTRLQLEQLRQWYSQLQQQTQKLAEQKLGLQQQLQQLRLKNDNRQNHNQQLQILKEKYQIDLQNKTEQINSLKNLSQDKDKIAQMLRQRESEAQLQIEDIKEKLEFQQKKVISLNQKINELNGQIELFRLNMQHKQIQTLQLNQQLRIIKQRNIQIQREIQEYKKINSQSQKQKEQVVEERQSRLKDLVARIKDKEESIARQQRQKQQVQLKLKQFQFTTEQYKQKLKKQEEEKTKLSQRLNSFQRENKEITRQLQQENRKASQDADTFNKTISKLKQNLEEEIQKRKQTQRYLKQVQSSKNDQVGNIKHLQAKISGYMQRQMVLKENLQIVENEITKITEIQIEKEQNQDYFNQTIINLNQTNSELNLRISELENQLATNKQRCQALEAEVQLLNAYMPEQQDQTQLLEMNKKLTEKNKELLEIIQQKNRVMNLLQRNEEQNKFSEAKKQLANSRQLKEMADLQNKILVLEEQNQKAYQELQRLNVKYLQELNILEASNQERVKELLSNIQLLNARVKSLQSKDWENFNQSKVIKEQLQKVQQNLNEKQFQVEIYKSQIKEQNQTIEGLKSQLNVLKLQYQSVYSQMGQKQFQLYQANAKLKQLQQILDSKKEISNHKQQHHAQIIDGEKKKYQKKINELQQTQRKLFTDKQELKTQREELRNKIQQLNLLLKNANFQFQNYKSNQKQYQQKINQIQYQQKVVISSLKETQQKQHEENQRLTQKIYSLQAQILNLKTQSSHSKKNDTLVRDEQHKEVSKSSQPRTPIQQFKQTSLIHVSRQKQNINMREIVEELTSIINKRKQQEEVEGVLRLVIDNNARQEEQFQRWNRQRGVMQQKAKLASKQLQKAKSAIMKNTGRSIAQKSQITGLLRPIEGVIGQLIQLSQTLSELDVEAQEEERQLQMDQKQEVRV